MFVFAIFATVVAVGFVYGLVTDISNGGGLGEEAPENYITTTDTSTTTSNVSTKANLTPNGEKIIGLRDASLITNSSELTTTTFDTTTYGDRAILKLTNETVYTATLTGLAIRGKVVLQQSGKNGYVWEYSDYDAIEKEGESFVEVSNDYIFDPVQAKSIGDFVWKELKPHKLYTLQLIGCHYEYEIGDVWHLTLSYTLNNGTMEDIDTDVEIMGSSISRSVGELGITTINLRVPSSAWELTLAKNAKLVGAGTSKRLNNRSNVVTVASSTWTGQADYYCADLGTSYTTGNEVQIQAAIDYVSSLGGGTVILTSGTFYIRYKITIPDNIVIIGAGCSTELQYHRTVLYSMIELTGSNITLEGFCINGDGINGYGGSGPAIDYSTTAISNINIRYVEIKNLRSNSISGYAPWGIHLPGTFNTGSVFGCYIHDFSNSISSGECAAISGGYNVVNNTILNILDTGSGYGYGILGCKKCQQNVASNCTTAKYYQSYADSASANACADTAAGGYNS